MASASYNSAEDWLIGRIGELPSSALGWFRCGVAFFNKREHTFAIECFQRSIELDPLNYNAFQIMARACIAVNRRDDAIAALKQSVKLDNPSDWQLLIELTAQQQSAQQAAAQASATAAASVGTVGTSSQSQQQAPAQLSEQKVNDAASKR